MKLLNMHMHSFIMAFRYIIKKPIEHALNVLVIALIIAILSSIFVIATSSQRWEKNNVSFPQIMIYLKADANAHDVSQLEASLNRFGQKYIADYQFISKEQGLSELQQDNDLKSIASDVITNNANPLPDILIVNTATTDTKILNRLTNHITNLPMVDEVEMDSDYANKVSNLINFVKHIATFLQIVFTVVFVLVVYNMIRLQMMLRQDEIAVSRLIGASDGFIMCPLAYYAILQVVLGLAVSYILVNMFAAFIDHLFLQLNSLFGHGFLLTTLTGFQLIEMLVILVVFTVFAVFVGMQWVFHNTK